MNLERAMLNKTKHSLLAYDWMKPQVNDPLNPLLSYTNEESINFRNKCQREIAMTVRFDFPNLNPLSLCRRTT